MPTLRDELHTDPSPDELGPTDRTLALADALMERFEMDEDDATAIASVVTEQFAGETEVSDDNLDPEVRSIFYTLEAKKLLTFRREEYSIETGERRRAFYWRVRDDELKRLQELSEQTGEENVYDQLPANVWSRPNA